MKREYLQTAEKNDIKIKRLPTFGTASERKDRLKNFYGLNINTESTPTSQKDNPPLVSKKSSCLDEIEKLKIQREERRARMEDVKRKQSIRKTTNKLLV